jgi:hypothetical protein
VSVRIRALDFVPQPVLFEKEQKFLRRFLQKAAAFLKLLDAPERARPPSL